MTRNTTTDGYERHFLPDHPMADKRGYVYAHRLVGCVLAGRYLLRHEQVHHRNDQRLDNDPANIEVCKSIGDHNSKRRKPRVEIACGCGCGSVLQSVDRHGRDRHFVRGHNRRSPGVAA